MTPNKLNELCKELYDRALKQVDSVLYTAQLEESQIDHVVYLLFLLITFCILIYFLDFGWRNDQNSFSTAKIGRQIWKG